MTLRPLVHISSTESIRPDFGRQTLDIADIYGLLIRLPKLGPSNDLLAEDPDLRVYLDTPRVDRFGRDLVNRHRKAYPDLASRKALPRFMESFVIEAQQSDDDAVKTLVSRSAKLDEAHGLPPHSTLGVISTHWWNLTSMPTAP